MAYALINDYTNSDDKLKDYCLDNYDKSKSQRYINSKIIPFKGYKNPEIEYTLEESIFERRDFDMDDILKENNSNLRDFLLKQARGLEKYIDVFNESCNGLPTIKNSNILISDILEMLVKFDNKQQMLENNKQLTIDDINAALKYVSSVFKFNKKEIEFNTINKKQNNSLAGDTIVRDECTNNFDYMTKKEPDSINTQCISKLKAMASKIVDLSDSVEIDDGWDD